jgi:chromosome segregation ATPase
MLKALTTFLFNRRSREIELLRNKVARLREDNGWLRSRLAQYKDYHAELNESIRGWKAENTKLKRELNQLKKVA